MNVRFRALARAPISINMWFRVWARLFLLFGFAVGYVLAGCAFSDFVFRLPRQEIEQQIYNGEYEFLRTVDYRQHDLHEAARLHDGARYYLSEIYRALGLDVVADDFLAGGWNRERAPWRYQAGLKILARLSDQKQYGRMMPIAADGVQEFKNERRYLDYYLEALYWEGQYQPLLALLPIFRAQLDFEQAYSINRVRWNSAEAQLWEAVSRYRERQGEYLPEFNELFFDYSASEYHTRVYAYIVDEPKLRDAFAPWELNFFKAKHLTATRSYSAAAEAYEEAFETLPIDQYTLVLTQRTIRDVGRTYFYGGYQQIGQERLQEVANHLSGQMERTTALEWRGRLLIHSKRYAEAQESLHAAYDAYPSDRTLWLVFDAAFSASFADGLASMEEYGGLIRNRPYYSDLFDRQTSLAVRERRWDDFWRLRHIAIRYGAPYDRARVAVVAAEAVRVGVTMPPFGVTRAELRAELDNARRQTESAHYAYLAGFLLGEGAGTRSFSLSRRQASQSSLSRNDCAVLIKGYLQFHLIEQGYDQLISCATHYRTNELIKIAHGLYERRVFNYAMRVIDIARRRQDFSFDSKTARVIYPRAYSEFIDEIAERNNIGTYFFYATIREESYFTHTVNSHAGAIGLGQFVPPTAIAVAKRMNLSDPDLTDPEQNLALSGFHLRELIDQLGNKQIFALAGYNAGINRARRWLRANDDYSDVLKHEGIPFTETRHYIRKIMVTNIQYARLYQGRPYTAVVKEYFTDLGQF